MNEFCQCEHCSSVTTKSDDFGCWDVCSDCGKPLEDSYRPHEEEMDIDE